MYKYCYSNLGAIYAKGLLYVLKFTCFELPGVRKKSTYERFLKISMPFVNLK